MIALAPEPAPKLCGRCGLQPAVLRSGALRCAECIAVGPVPRQRRKRSRPRSKTIARKAITRAELGREALTDADRVALAQRPRTRGECADGPRPCPWAACKHHLYLDIKPETGNVTLNFPDLDPDQLEHSCALDIADDGPVTLERTGELMNVTRERVRQLETSALISAAALVRRRGLTP